MAGALALRWLPMNFKLALLTLAFAPAAFALIRAFEKDGKKIMAPAVAV